MLVLSLAAASDSISGHVLPASVVIDAGAVVSPERIRELVVEHVARTGADAVQVLCSYEDHNVVWEAIEGGGPGGLVLMMCPLDMPAGYLTIADVSHPRGCEHWISWS